MRSKHFLFVSADAALITDLAWQVHREGHDVKYYIEAESDQEIGDGFIPKTDDWRAEVEWADVIIFQFPFWWFTMPAILKGWVDRVFSCGFAYGVGQYDEKNYGSRYGEGKLDDKRAMLSITIGGREDQYSERGINGQIDDLLFPIHHGIFWYAGISVLPPFLIYQSNSVSKEMFETYKQNYQQRLSILDTTEPIPFRYQNKGDYNRRQQLKKELVNGKRGFSMHLEG
jgi:NAD(P)H dehydrogenase (quinone)